MKLEIKTSYSRIVALENRESVHIAAGICEGIDPKDKRTYEKVLEDLFDECENFVLKNGTKT